MASDGRRVFVIGGALSRGAQADDTKPIHVLDTSMYFLSVISFGHSSSLKQSSSSTRNPTPTPSSIVKRPPISRRSYSQVKVNHNTGYSLHQTLGRRRVHFLSKQLPLKTWPTPPQRRLLVSETPVRMVCHHDPRLRVVGQDVSRRKTMMAKVQPSIMQRS